MNANEMNLEKAKQQTQSYVYTHFGIDVINTSKEPN